MASRAGKAGTVLWILMLMPGLLAAQQLGLGVTGAWMATGGSHVQTSCGGDEFRGGIGPTLSFAPRGGRLEITFTAKAYRMRDFGSCQAEVADQLPPPANGTMDFVDRHLLLSDHFATTDARAEYRLRRRLRVGAGGGVAWHEGVDSPYGLVSAEWLPLAGARTSFGLGLELQAVRGATDVTRVTYANSQVVSTEALPREWSWSHAVVVTARFIITGF
jgi:hypothetical protein